MGRSVARERSQWRVSGRRPPKRDETCLPLFPRSLPSFFFLKVEVSIGPPGPTTAYAVCLVTCLLLLLLLPSLSSWSVLECVRPPRHRLSLLFIFPVPIMDKYDLQNSLEREDHGTKAPARRRRKEGMERQGDDGI